jgi:hypothetical protein
VTLTDFTVHTTEDFRSMMDTAAKLRDAWPIMQGAVGLWLWGAASRCRGGSISLWADPADLQRFVRWPTHVAIMNNWRDRGQLTSDSWTHTSADPEVIWAQAAARLT